MLLYSQAVKTDSQLQIDIYYLHIPVRWCGALSSLLYHYNNLAGDESNLFFPAQAWSQCRQSQSRLRVNRETLTLTVEVRMSSTVTWFVVKQSPNIHNYELCPPLTLTCLAWSLSWSLLPESYCQTDPAQGHSSPFVETDRAPLSTLSTQERADTHRSLLTGELRGFSLSNFHFNFLRKQNTMPNRNKQANLIHDVLQFKNFPFYK